MRCDCGQQSSTDLLLRSGISARHMAKLTPSTDPAPGTCKGAPSSAGQGAAPACCHLDQCCCNGQSSDQCSRPLLRSVHGRIIPCQTDHRCCRAIPSRHKRPPLSHSYQDSYSTPAVSAPPDLARASCSALRRRLSFMLPLTCDHDGPSTVKGTRNKLQVTRHKLLRPTPLGNVVCLDPLSASCAVPPPHCPTRCLDCSSVQLPDQATSVRFPSCLPRSA